MWVHGDWARIDDEGYWYIEGRSDDKLKVAGKRVGPAEVESAAVAHAAVSEAAAVGVPHEIKGEGIVVFCVLRPGREESDILAGEIKYKIAELLGKPLRPERCGSSRSCRRRATRRSCGASSAAPYLGKSDLGTSRRSRIPPRSRHPSARALSMSADVDVLIVGAGHGGLGAAARLLRRRRDVLLVDANARVGDPWRQRWASLRLFTPRFYNALPGVPFPDGGDPFPSKDEVADYHERYARKLGVPLQTREPRDAMRRGAAGFEAAVCDETIRARNVVIATGAHNTPRIPSFASALGSDVTQLHTATTDRSAPSTWPVLVVGARNSARRSRPRSRGHIHDHRARHAAAAGAGALAQPGVVAHLSSAQSHPAWSARLVVAALAAGGAHVPRGGPRAKRACGTPASNAACGRRGSERGAVCRRQHARTAHCDLGDRLSHRRLMGRRAIG